MSEEVSNTKRGGVIKDLAYLLGILGTLTLTLGPYLMPEKFASEVENAAIHSNVEILKEEVKDELRIEYNEKLKHSEDVHKKLRIDIRNTRKEIADLKADLASKDELRKAMQKQIDFLLDAVTRLSKALILEMDIKMMCNWSYYETNGGDNFIIFNDWYECKTVQSTQVNTNSCKARIKPFDRDYIQVR